MKTTATKTDGGAQRGQCESDTEEWQEVKDMSLEATGTLKPAGHNGCRNDQPIAIDEGSGTSTQHVIVIESVDAEATGPGVKQERTEGEEDPQYSRDIQTGAAAGVVPPVATEDLATPPQARTRFSIPEVSGMLNVALTSETDAETLNVTHRLLHTGAG